MTRTKRKQRQKATLEEKERELETIIAHAKGLPRKNRREFFDAMDLTERQIADIKYQLAVADPAHAEVCGIPLSIAGLGGKSMKLRLRARADFNATSAGEVIYELWNSYVPVGTDPRHAVLDFSDSSGKLPWKSDTGLLVSPVVGTFGNTTDPAAVRTWDRAVVVPGGTQGIIQLPPLGLDLTDAVGRYVGIEARIRPVGNLLTTQGVGFMVTPGGAIAQQGNGLELKTIDELYGMQSNEIELYGLAGWNPEHCFRAVRYPQNTEEVTWVPMDWPLSTVQPISSLSTNPWAVFCAQGCTPNQPFVVEYDCIIEVRSNLFPFGTPNISTNSGLSLLSGVKEHGGHSVVRTAEIPRIAAAQMAQAQMGDHGVTKTVHRLAQASEGGFGSFLAKAGKFLLEKVADVGLSVLSEGMIPPGVGSAGVDAVFDLANSGPTIEYPALSGAEPLALPAPSHIPSLASAPPRVVVLPDLKTPTPEEGPDSEPEKATTAPIQPPGCSCSHH